MLITFVNEDILFVIQKQKPCHSNQPTVCFPCLINYKYILMHFVNTNKFVNSPILLTIYD